MDARMHDELRASFEHIVEASRAVAPDLASRLARAAERLAGGARFGPATFARYYELVDRIGADDLDTARSLATEIAEAEDRDADLQVLAMGAPNARDISTWIERRAQDGQIRYCPVPVATHAEFVPLLEEGMELLAAGVPDLHGELANIVHVVVLAQAPDDAELKFDGASHYQFWGMLLLNPNYHRTPLKVAEVLAHEAGHSALFGMTIDEPLVLNDESERFVSPLRPDPRPMDGIYHATFVSARMAMAMEALAASGRLGPEEAAEAIAAAERDRRNFEMGDAVIREKGLLSESGRAILDNARDWIAGISAKLASA